jgi:perosamine synthetase
MVKTLPFNIIPHVVPYLDETDGNAVLASIRENWISEGEQSSAFVDALKELIGVPYGVLAPNGTLALVLGLMALGIGSGDEVLIPDVTFGGTASAIIMVGATPVFVDVENENFQFDVVNAENCVTEKTKAIMPVHLYGTACDMQAIMEFADRHKLLIIEDAAQGIGVRYKNTHVGNFGAVGCFSFSANKTITTGEGGFVSCNDERIFKRLCLLRNQGRMERELFIHEGIGFNLKVTDMQSAMGLNQLKKLDKIITAKKLLYDAYKHGLKDVKQVRILGPEKNSSIVPFGCVIIAQRSYELQNVLEDNGVKTRSFFYPMHKQPCFSETSSQRMLVKSLHDSQYPNSNFGYENGLSLPLYPSLSLKDVSFISQVIASFYKNCDMG